MKPGDKIAIKASSTQKLNLPFDNQGHTVSKLTLKARGTVITNRHDGRTVEVEWDDDFKIKEWFFFTSRNTIWEIKLSDDYSLIKYSRKLIDFIWKDKPQDYEWFLEEWYGKKPPTVEQDKEIISHELYSIDDIVKSDIFRCSSATTLIMEHGQI